MYSLDIEPIEVFLEKNRDLTSFFLKLFNHSRNDEDLVWENSQKEVRVCFPFCGMEECLFWRNNSEQFIHLYVWLVLTKWKSSYIENVKIIDRLNNYVEKYEDTLSDEMDCFAELAFIGKEKTYIPTHLLQELGYMIDKFRWENKCIQPFLFKSMEMRHAKSTRFYDDYYEMFNNKLYSYPIEDVIIHIELFANFCETTDFILEKYSCFQNLVFRLRESNFFTNDFYIELVKTSLLTDSEINSETLQAFRNLIFKWNMEDECKLFSIDDVVLNTTRVTDLQGRLDGSGQEISKYDTYVNYREVYLSFNAESGILEEMDTERNSFSDKEGTINHFLSIALRENIDFRQMTYNDFIAKLVLNRFVEIEDFHFDSEYSCYYSLWRKVKPSYICDVYFKIFALEGDPQHLKTIDYETARNRKCPIGSITVKFNHGMNQDELLQKRELGGKKINSGSYNNSHDDEYYFGCSEPMFYVP